MTLVWGGIASQFYFADLGCCRIIVSCWFGLILVANNVLTCKQREEICSRNWRCWLLYFSNSPFLLLVASVSCSRDPLLLLWPVEARRETSRAEVAPVLLQLPGSLVGVLCAELG